jgi:8-oxo-dGTP diphosphatase
MAGVYTYRYPRPALTVDCVVLGLDDDDLNVLLIQRRLPPFAGCWALPGGFVELGETLEQAARRELAEETGLAPPEFEQLEAFDAIERDPRERVISVAFLVLTRLRESRPTAASDARRADWFPAGRLPELAFDHAQIIAVARERLRNRAGCVPIGQELLPRQFSLRQLRHCYETILGRELDPRRFRRNILGLDILVPLDLRDTDSTGHTNRLYRFDRRRYLQAVSTPSHMPNW